MHTKLERTECRSKPGDHQLADTKQTSSIIVSLGKGDVLSHYLAPFQPLVIRDPFS